MFINIKHIILIMLFIFLWITVEIIQDITYNSNELAADLKISEQTQLLDEIQSNIGYSGFIQNFENFLRYKNRESYSAAQKNLQNLRENIATYLQYSRNKKNIEALKRLDNIAADYEKRLQDAKALVQNNDVNKINAQIEIDISKAHLTLETLSKNIIDQITNIKANTKNDVGKNDKLIFYLRLMIPLIFIAAGLLFYLFIKLIRAKEEISRLAHFDTLTSLPNRSLFNDRLQQAIARAKRGKTKIALLFIDLDGFKKVNDEYGHNVGDELLKTVAEQLKTIIREQDTAARLGGDEFTIILEGLKEVEYAVMVAEKINVGINKITKINNQAVNIGTSIGISIYPEDTEQADMLIIQADTAMYAAKQAGKNHCKLFAQI